MVLNDDHETKVLAIIGNPIVQVKSPDVFGNYFRANGINAEMIPFRVYPSDFETVLSGLRRIQNFAGAVVTIPHKQAAFNAAVNKGVNSRAAMAANVIIPSATDQWSCEMLDGVGLINALKTRGMEPKGLRTLIIGAGGAGTAIAVALQQIGNVGKIGVADLEPRRAKELVKKLDNAEVVNPGLKDYQLVINASPVGMGTQELPFDPQLLIPETIVCDAIMYPTKTRLLSEAEKRGCVIVPGIEMLLGQVETIINFFGLQVN